MKIKGGISGVIEVEGEKIYYIFRGVGKGESVIEAYYGQPISISDHGLGLEYAEKLLRLEVETQKNKRKSKP
jgi:hypothetical protein